MVFFEQGDSYDGLSGEVVKGSAERLAELRGVVGAILSLYNDAGAGMYIS